MLKIRGMNLPTLGRAWLSGLRPVPRPRHVFLCIADHFEPDWAHAPRPRQIDRVARWTNEYPGRFASFVDSRGRSPQHTFFYPMEVYDREHIDQLTHLVRAGHGDIEIHLHHDNDCSANLTERLDEYRNILHDQHGLLSRDSLGNIRYGFIHGNWALDNSHPEGKHCGVNDELSILMQTGCYADFTMPAAPHPAQTRTINQIYYAADDPNHPKSHDVGIQAAAGKTPPENRLLIVQGPLVVAIERNGWRARLRLENGNLAGSQPPSGHRIRRWLQAGVSVLGRPDWLFVKLHTHGAQEANMQVLLGEPMLNMHRAWKEHADTIGCRYYYVTAREMAQLIHQAEAGLTDPDFEHLQW